jgi:D-amino peptidase
MKVYISVDIEGVCGITHWDEAEIGKPGYERFRDQMTAEAAAACEGALAAGVTDLVVKDAHWTARNIIPERQPEDVRLIRGWTGDPLYMITEIDESFDALAVVGYHSGAGNGGNPLAHTAAGSEFKVLVNGEAMSEYRLHSLAAAELGIPTVFLSGDTLLCESAKAAQPAIHTVATNTGKGAATVSIHPARAVDAIRSGVEAALKDKAARALPALSDRYELELWYDKNEDAYAASFYPGATLHAPHAVRFEADRVYEIMRMLQFALVRL